MKNKAFKRIISENKVLFFVLSLSIIIIFSPYLFFGYDYRLSLSNDHIFQINQFYSEFINLIHKSLEAKSPIFYSWNTYLGSNFYAGKAYYCTGDFLLIIAALLFKNLNSLHYLLFETILCLYISCFSFKAYLNNLNIKHKYLINIYSLIYSLGGCTIIYLQYPMFLRFYAFLPLLFLGVDNYLKQKKLLLFSIAVTILLLQNYYLMVPTTLFLPIYFIFTSYINDESNKFNIVYYLKNSIKLIIAYIIGALASMILILPAFHFITGSNRLTYNELSNYFTWPITTWISLIFYTLIPINTTIVEQPFMVNLNTEAPAVTNYYSTYVSSLGFLGLISFFNSKIEKNISYIVVLLILLISNMVLPINSLIHIGTTPTMRFSFLLFFFFMITSIKGLDNIETNNMFKTTLITCATIFVVAIFVNRTIISSNIIFIILVFLSSLLILLELKFINLNKLLLVIVLFELIGYNVFYVTAHPFEKYEDDISSDIFAYYIEQDDDILFRYAVDSELIRPFGSKELNLNSSMVYGYKGLTTYDTTYDYSLDEFIEITDSKYANNIINSNNPNLYKLLGVKYVLVKNEDELDSINEYEYAYDIGSLKAYKLLNNNSIGHAYSEFVTDENNIDFDNQVLLDSTTLNLVKDITKTNSEQLIITEQISDNNFCGYINLNSKQLLLLSIPYDSGWTIKDNDQIKDTYSVDGGLTGIILDSGEHYIEAWYQPKGFKVGFIFSIIGIIGYIKLFINDRN